MSETNRNNSLRRWGRRFLWGVAVVVGLAILLRLSLKTTFVHNWVKDYAVSAANQQLNAELSIDRLSGDLWREVQLSDLRMMRADTIARIDSIHATYDIWAALGGRFVISDLTVYQPRADLRQSNGRWNVQNLIPETEDTTGSFSLTIDNFELRGGNVSVQSDSLPAESHFTINKMMLVSSLEYEDEEYDIQLRDLSFQLENTELEQPLKVQTSASAQNNSITLERLILATGNSVIASSGYASPSDSSIQFDFSAAPVSWRDIASYAHNLPLRNDMTMDLSLSGKPEQFALTLFMESAAMDSLEISSRFKWRSSLVLESIEAKVRSVDFAQLLADTALPRLESFDAEFSGRIDVANYRQGKGDLTFSLRNITQGPYHLDMLSAKGSLNHHEAEVDVEARTTGQRITAELQVDQLWDDLPVIQSKIYAANIDPAYWMQDSSYAGDMNVHAEISGRGWDPLEGRWNYSLEVDESRFMEQPIAGLSAQGEVEDGGGSMEARMDVRDGTINLWADFQDLTGTPAYSYRLVTRNLDLSEVLGRDDFETALNGEIKGNGRGFDLASMQQRTSVSIDSSLVNKELLRNLSAELLIRDSTAVVDSARLQSAIAEGSFSLRMNLLDLYNPQNELAVDLLLKELDTVAPLAGADSLGAEGTVKGTINPLGDEDLQFEGALDLSDVKYNQLFAAEQAKGTMVVQSKQNLLYSADLNLSRPVFSGVQLQDLSLKTGGTYADSTAKGKYEFQFSSPNEGRIEQSGSYSLMKDSASVLTETLNFISDYRTLALEKPFELMIRNDSLRMDTMRIASADDEAFLEIGIPVATAEEQQGYVRGESLNTSVIQSSLFGKTLFEGMLSGEFEINRIDTLLDARGKLLLSDITYLESDFDSLVMNGQIKNERAEGTLSVKHQGKELMSGDANLPFKLGDPEAFPDSFFEEPVSGKFYIRDMAIEYFESLFAEAGLEQTSGILSFRGILDGSAGQPNFTADAQLTDATLSGVKIDSVLMGANYRHKDAEVMLDASVLSLRQKAAQINGRFPLFIDVKNLAVELPEAQDSIAVDIETNSFNLKAFNDFLDRRTYREVQGQLNGMVRINGPMEDLKTDGEFLLKNGSFRFVPAGIRMQNIQSEVDFFANQIRLTNFSAKSGKGNMTAQGVLAIDNLVPGGFDISVGATNFRAANTPQYNAVVNLDARVQGGLTQPRVSGSLDFVSGFLEMQNFGEKSVEKVELDSLEDNGPTVSYYDSLALDMDVSFDRRFYIRNQRYLDMEVELAGTLDLVKERGEDLELFGSMTAPGGYARPFGKQFDLEEGSLTFSGAPANPQLAIRTRYEPPQTQENVIIWYVIEGTVEDPQFKYESEPQMELENIISYTLFGQPFYALDSWKQVVASSGSNTTAADVAFDVLLDRVEALATQKLGIDVVRIDNSRAGGETGTSITTGWYLNPKVFFAIQNMITGSTPDTGFLLEYMLRKDLKLIIRQGEGMSQGVDLKWNYDY